MGVVQRVKFASSTSRYPTADEVRAQTSDDTAPFTQLFAQLSPGQTLYCSALAYDAAGNESALAQASVTAPGASSPTPFAMFLRGTGMLTGNYGSFSTTGLSAAGQGDPISVWVDQTGNKRHLFGGISQITNTYNAGSAPTRDGNEATGFGYLQGRVEDTEAEWMPTIGTGEVHVLIGVRCTASPPADNNTNCLWNLGASGDSSTPAERFPDTTGHIIEHAFLNAALDLGDVAASYDLTQRTAYSIAAGGPSSTVLPSLWVAKINGTEVKRSDRSASGAAFPYLAYCNIGTDFFSRSFAGHISDFIVFDGILSAAEEAAWTPYLLGTTNTPPTASQTPTLSYVFDGGDVLVTATAPLAESAKIAASLSATPSDADVRAVFADTEPPFTFTFAAPTGSETLHVAAFVYTAGAESSKVTLDIAPDAASTSTSAFVPSWLLSGETFTVPARRQAVFTYPIDVDGVLDVFGILAQVD